MPHHFHKRKVVYGRDYEALAGFIIFVILLFVGFLFLIARLARVLIPAAMVVLGIGVVMFLLFHLWSQATIAARSTRRLEHGLRELARMERLGAEHGQTYPLTKRLDESAQAMADVASVRLRRVSKRNERLRRRWEQGKASWSDDRSQQMLHEERALLRELESIRCTYDVVPDHDRWRRFYHLHRERDWIRWLLEHPRAGLMISGFVFLVLVTAVAAVM